MVQNTKSDMKKKAGVGKLGSFMNSRRDASALASHWTGLHPVGPLDQLLISSDPP